ncbi:MAG: DUF2163 domain-containing protein [Alphaproteobacteria bacterium]|nr:DUF2163 domain-containing protein [Alphaproteobacteria bacterium]
MKTIPAPLQDHLNGELTTLATLVKVTRRDGAVKAFTTHDRDIALGGVTYLADGALSPSAIESRAGLASGNLDIAGMLDSAAINGEDIKAGLYDHARVDIYVCNWAAPADGAVQLRRGWLGEVTLSGGQYVAELRGLHDLLQREIGDYVTPECRHDLGDAQCGVDTGAITVNGTVTGVTGDAVFTDSGRSEADETFAYGKLTWTGGANTGLAMEVKAWDGAARQFTLWLPMPHGVQAGDTYSVYPGCDKRLATCSAKFSNVANFGGFPHLPGIDRLLQYPDSK